MSAVPCGGLPAAASSRSWTVLARFAALLAMALAAPAVGQQDVAPHQKPETPHLMRRRQALERLAAPRPTDDLLDATRELPDPYSGGRPRPDVKTSSDTMAEIRSRLLRATRDEDALCREALFLFALPELVDPDHHLAVHLTVKALWTVKFRGEARVSFRIRDASGLVRAELSFPEPVTEDAIQRYQVTRAFPVADLPDGHYVGEARLTVGGRAPRDTDQTAWSSFSIQRGFLARARALTARRSAIEREWPAEKKGAPELACLDAVLQEVDRVVSLGDPHDLASDPLAALAEAERRLACLESGKEMFAGVTGDLLLGWRTELGNVHPYRVFVPSRMPPAGFASLLLLPEAGGSEAVWFDIHGRGELLARADDAGVLLVAPRSPSASFGADRVLVRTIADARHWFRTRPGRISGAGHGAGAAQLLLEARREPDLFGSLFLLGAGWISKDDVAALRKVKILSIQSSLSPQLESNVRMFEVLEAQGGATATLEVASGVPVSMLPGRYLGRIVSGQ